MAIVDKSGSHWEKEANAIQYIKLNIYCLSLATVKRRRKKKEVGERPEGATMWMLQRQPQMMMMMISSCATQGSMA